MSTLVKGGIAVAVLGSIGIFGPYLAGTSLESHIDTIQIETQEWLQVNLDTGLRMGVTMDRGWFNSKVTETYTYQGEVLEVVSDVKHGPILIGGSAGFGMGLGSFEVVDVLANGMSIKSSFDAHGKFGFGKGFSLHLKTKPYSDPNINIASVTLDVKGTWNDEVNIKLAVPSAEVSSPMTSDGAILKDQYFEFTMAHVEGYGFLPVLFDFRMKHLDVMQEIPTNVPDMGALTNQLTMDNFSYRAGIHDYDEELFHGDGEMVLDKMTSTTTSGSRVVDNDFGPMRMSFRMANLHMPSYIRIVKELERQSRYGAMSGQAQLTSEMRDAFNDLIAHHPEMHIDDIYAMLPQGEVNGNFSFIMAGGSVDDPESFLQNVTMEAFASIPRALLYELVQMQVRSDVLPSMIAQMKQQSPDLEISPMEMEALVKEQSMAMIQGLEMQGFIQNDPLGNATVQVQLKDGAIMVNGVPQPF